jgi:S1-C subfamily serine protease
MNDREYALVTSSTCQGFGDGKFLGRYASTAFFVMSGISSLNTLADEVKWTEIAARDSNATILIRTAWAKDGQYLDSSGTGFVVGTSKSILTVSHLFPNDNVKVVVSGEVSDKDPTAGTHSISLSVSKINREADFAILTASDSDVALLDAVPVDMDWKPAEGKEVHIRGFPLGGALEGYGGTVTTSATSDSVPTTTLLQAGYSGAPVYDSDGVVVGMARGGTPVVDSNDPTIMGRGFFVPFNFLAASLPQPFLRDIISFSPPKSNGNAASREELRLSYPIDETKETPFNGPQDLARPESSKDYETGKIYAQPGYRISTYALSVISANGLSNRVVTIAPGGEWIEMKYTLTSGPGWNRTRGWLAATLTTIQKRDAQ